MTISVNIELSPKQFEFVYSDKELFSYFAGIGTGKTFAGSMFSLLQMIQYPEAVGFIGANTVKQLHLSTLPPFWRFLRQWGIKYVFNKRPPVSWGQTKVEKHDGVISARVNGKLVQIYTFTLENYEAYRGIEIGWFWIDETRDTREEAISVLFERMRGFNKYYPEMIYKGRFTTTPNGFDHMYDKFVKEPLKNSAYVQAPTKENAHNLPPNFIENTENRLGKMLARQQLNCEFVSLTVGRMFTFDRNKHITTCAYNPNLPLIWSMDFNVSPMAGLVMQTDKEKVWVLDEVCIIDNAQTKDAVTEFCRRWQGAGNLAVIAWGDMAGAARDTRGYESDIDIMLKILRNHFHTVKDGHDYAQRLIVDGVNAVNALYDHDRLFIDERCENLIQDMEKMHWKPGTKVPEKEKDKTLTHFGDSLRYPIAQMFELQEHMHENRNFATNGRIF